jgi:hypothetical protein
MLKNQYFWPALILGMACFFAVTAQAQTAGSQHLRGQQPEAVARFHLQPAGRLSATQHLNLAIGLPLRNEAALNSLLQQIYDPASPNFRQYLKPEQFTEQFGPTEQDYQAVIAFAQANGLTVTGTHSGRTLVDVSGSVADVERIFHVAMRTYRHPAENRTFFAPDAEPSIDLAVPILHISGLDDFIKPRPMSLKITPLENSALVAPAGGSGPSGRYMGNDFRAAYAPGVSLDGSGQVVGLLEFDGYYTSDITNYEQQAGLPNVPLQNVYIDNYSGNAGANNDEVALDIEMAIAMAPGLSQVLVYEEQNGSNIVDMLDRMATDNLAKQISSSWLVGNNPSFDTAYKQFAAQGQSFFQASGDDGAFYSGIAQWADDTNITLVGGTTLTTSGPNGAWVSEKAWNWFNDNSGTAGGGGGISFNSIPIPSWQQGINMTTNKGSTTLRNIPDVALTADNIYVVYDNGISNMFGGTSCAAPLWAGFTALINQQAAAAGRPTVGFINPAVYAIGKSTNFIADFHDITTGNNTNHVSRTNFFAVAGYDLCTGWGTPAGTNLINALFGFTDPLGVTPSTNFIAVAMLGDSFNVTSQNYSLTNWGSVSLNWSLINTSSWLNVSATSGALTPGGASSTVTISLTSSTTNLTVGTYSATVWFTNQTTGFAQLRQFTLQVFQPLAVSPTNGFTSSGPVGGPFGVATQNFSLTNLGADSLNWSVNSTPSWLTASPNSGALAAGGQTTFTVSLNSNANSLASGTYNANVVITNQNGGTIVLPFTLLVGQSLVQNGGFETGNFNDWTLAGNGIIGTTIYNAVVSAAGPVSGGTQFIHSGTYGAFLGDTQLATLSQTLNTFPGQGYLLSFWLANPVSGSVQQFLVNWNTNSPGINRIYYFTNPPVLPWTNITMVVTATGTNATLQFGAENDPDGFGLDDVTLTPIPAPSFRTVLKTNNLLQFSWNSLAGVAYQLQFTTNLPTTNWVNLGAAINATNGIAATTNNIGPDPQRFYRIRRLP